MKAEINLLDQKAIVEEIVSQHLQAKSVLILGQEGVGKTTFLNHLVGTIFQVVENDDGQECLKGEIQQSISDQEGLVVQFNIINYNSPEHGLISLVEMPSLTSYDPQASDEENYKIKMIKLYIWTSVIYWSKEVLLCFVLPYTYTSQLENIKSYFTFWEQIVRHDEAELAAIRKSVYFVISKACYDEDKNDIVAYLKDLPLHGQLNISADNFFEEAVDNERIQCFLAQDTAEGQGNQFLSRIIANCQFVENPSWTLFAKNWLLNTTKFALQGEMMDAQVWGSKLSEEERINIVKNVMQPFLKSQDIVKLDLQVVGAVGKFCLKNCLQKAANLKDPAKKLLKNLTQTEAGLVKQYKYLLQLIPKFQPNDYVELFCTIHDKICSEQQKEESSTQFFKSLANSISYNLEKEIVFFDFFGEATEAALTILNNSNLPSSKFMAEITPFLKKQLKTDLISFVQEAGIFGKLVESVPQIKQSPRFNELSAFYNEDKGSSSEEVEEEYSNNQVLKRDYCKRDMIDAMIKENKAKVLASDNRKKEDECDKDKVKKMLNEIAYEKTEKRMQKIRDLAQLAGKYAEYEIVLECIMDLDSHEDIIYGIQLFFQDLIESSPSEIKAKGQFTMKKLVPFLENQSKCAATTLNKFQYCNALRRCYDLISCELCETPEQYQQIQELYANVQYPEVQPSERMSALNSFEDGESLRLGPGKFKGMNQVKVSAQVKSVNYVKAIKKKQQNISPNSVSYSSPMAKKEQKNITVADLKYLNLEGDRKREIFERFEQKELARTENWLFLDMIRRLQNNE